MTWDDYVHLAFDEIRMAGAGSPQVVRRLRAALETCCLSRRKNASSALQEQLNLLESGAEEAISEPGDRVIRRKATERNRMTSACSVTRCDISAIVAT